MRTLQVKVAGPTNVQIVSVARPPRWSMVLTFVNASQPRSVDPLDVIAHANDNRPVEPHVPALGRQPVPVGRWRQNELTGQLECRWTLEAFPTRRPAVSRLTPRRRQGRSSAMRISNGAPAISCTGLAEYLHILLPLESAAVCCNDNCCRRPFLMQSKGSDRLPPEYWQTRADKVRAIADEMFDLRSRETLLRIARDYEDLARRAEERYSTTTASAY